ncbi:MAG: hypothetical protein ACRCVA_18185 [Phreatobacter sp.]
MTATQSPKTGIISRIDQRRASFLFAALAAVALVSGIITSSHGEAAAAHHGTASRPVLESTDDYRLATASPRAQRLPRSPQRFIGTAEAKRMPDRYQASTPA